MGGYQGAVGNFKEERLLLVLIPTCFSRLSLSTLVNDDSAIQQSPTLSAPLTVAFLCLLDNILD